MNARMNTHNIDMLLAEIAKANKKYLEFIRTPDLSVGVYRLRAGERDEQKPHTEDEVYYVISGRAKFKCAADVHDVGPGAILFVTRGVEHRFIDIVEELVVLVFFGPAEGTAQR